MAEPIVTELFIDARGATEGSAEFVAAMSRSKKAAQGAFDASLDASTKLATAMEKGLAHATGGIQSIARIAREWQKLTASIDPSTAAAVNYGKAVEKAAETAELAVRRLGVSQTEALRVQRQATLAAQQQWQNAGSQALPASMLPRGAQRVQTGIDTSFGIGAAAANSARDSAAVFDSELRRMEEIAEMRARQIGQTFNAELNRSFGIGGPSAVSLGATFSALDEEMKRLDEVAKMRAAQIGGDFHRGLNESFGIGGPSATSLGATFSALEDDMKRLEDIAKARAAQNLISSQQGIDASFGIGVGPAKSARDSAIAFQEAAQEADRFQAQLHAIRSQIDPVGTAQAKLNMELAEYNRLAGMAGGLSQTELAQATGMANASFERQTLMLRQAAAGARLHRHELANLSYQINDIFVMAASGQAPFMLLMQQGMQVGQIFQGQKLGEATKSFGQGILAFITNPINLAVLGIASLAAGVAYLWTTWKSGAPTVEDSLKRQKELVNDLRASWGDAGSAALKYQTDTRGVTELRGGVNILDLERAAEQQKQAALNSVSRLPRIGEIGARPFEKPTAIVDKEFKDFAPLILGLKSGEIGIEQFRRGVATTADTVRPFNADIDQTADKLLGIFDATTATTRSVEAFNRELGILRSGIRPFNAAMDDLSKFVPDTRLDTEKIDEAYNKAINSAKTYSQVIGATKEYDKAIAAVNDPFEQRLLSAKESIENAKIDIGLIGQTAGEIARLRADYAAYSDLRREAEQNNKEIDLAQLDRLMKLNAEMGRFVQRAAEAKMADDLFFQRQQMDRSDLEQTIAERLRSGGTKPDSAAGESLANQMRLIDFRKQQKEMEIMRQMHGLDLSSISAKSPSEKADLAARRLQVEAMRDGVITSREQLAIDQARAQVLAQETHQLQEAARLRGEGRDRAVQEGQFEIDLVGKTAGEVARLRYEHEQLEALKRYAFDHGIEDWSKEADAIRATAAEVGRLSQALAEKNLIEDITFDRAQLGRSAIDQQIASQLRSAGVDANSAQGVMIADQMRFNEQLRITQDLGKEAFKGFISDIRSGVAPIDALTNALTRFSDKLLDMAIDDIFSGLFNTDPVAGRQPTGLAGTNGGMLSRILGNLFGGGAAPALSGTAGNNNFPAAGGMTDLLGGQTPLSAATGTPVPVMIVGFAPGMATGGGLLSTIFGELLGGNSAAPAGLNGSAGTNAFPSSGGMTDVLTQAVAKAVASPASPASGQALGFVGNYRSGVDPRLTEILNLAAQRSPYSIQAFSGYRPGDTRFHGQGLATDVNLIDRATGQALPNYQNAGSFRQFEEFAQIAKQVQMEKFPELADKFRWGGYFSGRKGVYGAVDQQHFDLGGGRGVGMAGGSWGQGLTDAQRRLFPGAESIGMDGLNKSIEQMTTKTETFVNEFGVNLEHTASATGQIGQSFSTKFSSGLQSILSSIGQGGGGMISWAGGLFNSSFGGTGPMSLPHGVYHKGGFVGANDNYANDNARFDPWMQAPRMHGGGGFGLAPDERRAVLQTGELVLSRQMVASARQTAAAPMQPVVVQPQISIVKARDTDKAETREVSDGRGGRRTEVVFTEMVAAANASPRGMSNFRKNLGLSGRVTRR